MELCKTLNKNIHVFHSFFPFSLTLQSNLLFVHVVSTLLNVCMTCSSTKNSSDIKPKSYRFLCFLSSLKMPKNSNFLTNHCTESIFWNGRFYCTCILAGIKIYNLSYFYQNRRHSFQVSSAFLKKCSFYSHMSRISGINKCVFEFWCKYYNHNWFKIIDAEVFEISVGTNKQQLFHSKTNLLLITNYNVLFDFILVASCTSLKSILFNIASIDKILSGSCMNQQNSFHQNNKRLAFGILKYFSKHFSSNILDKKFRCSTYVYLNLIKKM